MLLSSNGIAVTSFAAPEVWSALLQIFIIALAVLAGNILRRKVTILRRSLIPSALLGGLIIPKNLAALHNHLSILLA